MPEQSGMDPPTTTRSDFPTRLHDELAGTLAGKNLFLSPFSIRVAHRLDERPGRGGYRRGRGGLL
jgi:hypothetical protein